MPTVSNALRRFINLVAVLVAGFGFMSIATAPAHAAPTSNPHRATVIVDIAFVAKKSTWINEKMGDEHGDLYGNVQVSGAYVTAEGAIITYGPATDPKNWRARAAIEKAWGDTWLVDLKSHDIDKMMRDSLKLGTITIDSITVSDQDHPNGSEVLYKIADRDNRFAFLRPTASRETSVNIIVRTPIEIGKKYFAYVGEYNEQDKVASLPIVVTEKYRADAYNFKATAIYSASAPLGALVVKDGSKVATGMLVEDTADQAGAGSLMIVSNESLVAFAQKNGVSVGGAVTGPTTETSASVTPSSEPSATTTESPAPSETASSTAEPSATAAPVPPVTDGGNTATPQWVTLLPFIIGLAGAVGLTVFLLVSRRGRRRAAKQAAAYVAYPTEWNGDDHIAPHNQDDPQ
jgi:hypothetical protein